MGTQTGPQITDSFCFAETGAQYVAQDGVAHELPLVSAYEVPGLWSVSTLGLDSSLGKFLLSSLTDSSGCFSNSSSHEVTQIGLRFSSVHPKKLGKLLGGFGPCSGDR